MRPIVHLIRGSYELYVKQKMKEGLADIEAGRTIPHEALKAEIPGNAD